MTGAASSTSIAAGSHGSGDLRGFSETGVEAEGHVDYMCPLMRKTPGLLVCSSLLTGFTPVSLQHVAGCDICNIKAGLPLAVGSSCGFLSSDLHFDPWGASSVL